MEKKKNFKRLLSFLVAASLVHAPIVCANDLPEWMNNLLEGNDVKNAIFWPVFATELQKTLNQLKVRGKTSDERQSRSNATADLHARALPWSQFLHSHNLKEEGVPNCSADCNVCTAERQIWRIKLIDTGTNENRCVDNNMLCLGCLGLHNEENENVDASLVTEDATCPCGKPAKKIELKILSAAGSSDLTTYYVYSHGDMLLLEDTTGATKKYFNVDRPRSANKIFGENEYSFVPWMGAANAAGSTAGQPGAVLSPPSGFTVGGGMGAGYCPLCPAADGVQQLKNSGVTYCVVQCKHCGWLGVPVDILTPSLFHWNQTGTPSLTHDLRKPGWFLVTHGPLPEGTDPSWTRPYELAAFSCPRAGITWNS
ncbi:MAG: hypothetical protein LBJ83_03590 [Oscillospiraceae bacterium]|jgi:hypothetical protein|nr:hypothetical protein [Oscillospiraceae bacterium]